MTPDFAFEPPARRRRWRLYWWRTSDDIISDPGLKAALQEAHAERWGLFVGLWPIALLVLSLILKQGV